MNPETLQRAYEIHCHQQLAGHEAAHAAAAMRLGLRVFKVTAPFWRLEDVEDRNPDDPAGCAWMERRSDPDGLRNVAIATIAGKLEDGRPGWPPRWPLTLAPEHGDEADLCQLVEELDLDAKGYSQLVDDALQLTTTQAYERLRVAIGHGLELHGTLDEDALRKIKAIAEETGMQHKLVNVVDTEVDEGLMIALASTWEVDKVKDRVLPGAYAEAVAKIKSGDYLPLVWQHDLGSPGNFVGEIVDANETGQGLEVTARFDLDDADGLKAYKLVKRGSIKSLSIGYRVLQERRAPGGITELVKVELHEVSLVLSPANPGARILAVKGDDAARDDVPSLEELRARERALGLDEEEQRRQAIVDEFRTLLTDAMGHTNGNGNGNDPKSARDLRAKAERIAREHAPIEIASFEC